LSEYQYYEFVAVGRPLSPAQQGELRALSTRAEIGASSFVNTYEWGDFKGDPRALMEGYFDAFLYLTNWGTRVMLRVPVGLLDLDTAVAYCVGDSAQAWATREHLILEVCSEDEEADWESDGEGLLTSIVPVRAELAAGDMRLLYLAWLLCVQAREVGEDEPEPPVPAGLGELSGSLDSLADFLRLDRDLLAVAAEASGKPTVKAPSPASLARWVKRLPEADKDTIVLRLLRGDEAHLRTELLRRYHGEPARSAGAAGGRTAGQMLAAAEARWAGRQRLAEQRAAAERVRREQVAAAAREQRLKALAEQGEQPWHRVASMIETRKPKEYDAAIELLVDLKALAERDGRGAAFTRRVRQLRAEHARKPACSTASTARDWADLRHVGAATVALPVERSAGLKCICRRTSIATFGRSRTQRS
jgi:hypothetical protein